MRDLMLAARTLSHAPMFTGVAALTLALGLGANTAIFSVIYGSLLRPLPYADTDGLVWLSDGHPDIGGSGVNQSVPNFLDLRDGSKLMRSAAVYRRLGANLAAEDQAERVTVLYTSSEMLGVLGVSPALGRDLLPSDDLVDAEPVTLLTDALWQTWFGGDPAVVGRTAVVDARPVRIAGVLPRDFWFPGDPRLIMPIQHVGAELSRGSRSFNGVGRLAPGADVEGLRAELQGIFSGLVASYPDANEGWFTWAEPLSDWVVGGARRSLLLMSGAVALVLLIAVVNVANLLLVRAETRHRELAVRYSLGARRTDLLSLFLAEAVLLAVAGGTAGVVTAYWGVDALVTLFADALPRPDAISVNGTVLAVGLALSLAVGILVGLVPLARIRPDRLQSHLKDGSRGSSGRGGILGGVLVATEVALAVVVVAGAGLLANSVWRIQQVDLGVTRPERVMTFTMTLPATSYPDVASIQGFSNEIDRQIAALPGVEAVGFVNRLPLLGGDNTTVTPFGDPERQVNFTSIRYITPGYLDATGVPLLTGRWLDPEEFSSGAPAVVINETLARRLFPDQDPVGRNLGVRWAPDGLLIVGVIGDIAGGRPDRPPPPAFYLPLATVLEAWSSVPRGPNDYWGVSALVRTAVEPRSLMPAFRRTVAEVDPQLPLNQVRTLQDIAVERLGARRFAMSLFGVFSAMALLLGAVGIYGVMSYTVAQRSRELGMRMALGATRTTVRRMMLGRGARIVIPGLVVGVAAALPAGKVLGGLLYEVSPQDPWTYLGVAALLGAVGLAATWLPAHRATRVDPMESMRAE